MSQSIMVPLHKGMHYIITYSTLAATCKYVKLNEHYSNITLQSDVLRTITLQSLAYILIIKWLSYIEKHLQHSSETQWYQLQWQHWIC